MMLEPSRIGWYRGRDEHVYVVYDQMMLSDPQHDELNRVAGFLNVLNKLDLYDP